MIWCLHSLALITRSSVLFISELLFLHPEKNEVEHSFGVLRSRIPRFRLLFQCFLTTYTNHLWLIHKTRKHSMCFLPGKSPPLPSPPPLQISIKEAIQHPSLYPLSSESIKGNASSRVNQRLQIGKNYILPSWHVFAERAELIAHQVSEYQAENLLPLSRLGSWVSFCILIDLVLLLQWRLKFWTTLACFCDVPEKRLQAT